MRNYKRKHASQWRDKDKRMTLAVQMRGQGMSLREIAKELAVDEKTVRNDLARWEQSRPNVVLLVRKTDAENCPAGGEIPRPDSAPEPAVTELRRRA